MRDNAEGLSILLVENEFLLARNLQRTMEAAGAGSIGMAGTLKEANELIESAHYDAAILDLRLMDGDAVELANELIGRGTAVVIHSGHASPAYMERMPGAHYLPKPATRKEIVKSVLTAIG